MDTSLHRANSNKSTPLQQFIRKNLFTAVLLALLGTILFVPNAKALFLKGLLATGIFNAGIKTETGNIHTAAIAALSFIDINGKRLNVADLTGKVIFINFWADWCPPCIAEMGSVNSLYNKLKHNPRFVFVLADADNNLQQAMAFMNKHQYDLPVYQIARSFSGDLFSGVLPTTLIIDSKGNLVQKHEGIANYDTEKMIKFLQSL